MKHNPVIIGTVALLIATVAWGSMFPLVKILLPTLNAFYLSSIRYGIASLIFLLILAQTEGWAALRYEGKSLELLFFGTLGFAGFSLFSFVGLSYASPEHAAIIMALMPLITAVIQWVTNGTRPHNFTLACIAAALVGVVLVITKGQLHSASGNHSNFGSLLIFLGALCWVIYTLGTNRFKRWSPLRYTALTCVLGTLSMIAITFMATQLRYITVPSLSTVFADSLGLAYMILIASVVAVLAWNIGIKLLGPLNGVLFINLVPITAFTIGALEGHHFAHTELIGATLTIAALVANNLYARRLKKLIIT